LNWLFDLLPTGYQFSKGRRIRNNRCFADAENFETPVIILHRRSTC